jgi:hypothetical protein
MANRIGDHLRTTLQRADACPGRQPPTKLRGVLRSPFRGCQQEVEGKKGEANIGDNVCDAESPRSRVATRRKIAVQRARTTTKTEPGCCAGEYPKPLGDQIVQGDGPRRKKDLRKLDRCRKPA